MKYLFSVMFCLSMYSTPLLAQTPQQLADIKAFETARYNALTQKDFGTTEKLVADALIYTHSNTVVEDKATYLAALRSGKYDFKAFSTDSTQYRMVGKNTVVAAGSVEMQLLYQGRDVKLSGRFTAVYVKRQRQWQLLAWQTTKRA